MIDGSGMARMGQPNDTAQELRNFKREVEQLLAARNLESASIGSGGLRIQSGGSATVADGGAFLVVNAEDEVVARYGELVNSAPGQYGLEVLVDGTWVRLGAQTGTWDNIAGKPAEYDPIYHRHDIADIDGSIDAATAQRADGVTNAAFNRVVAGIPGEWQAMYMHSNGQIGRGSSLQGHKVNERPVPELEEDPYAALAVDPLIYDRLAGSDPDEYTPIAQTNELGAIAEQVAEILPQLGQYYHGDLVGIRHEVGWLTLIPALRAIVARQDKIEQQQSALDERLRRLENP